MHENIGHLLRGVQLIKSRITQQVLELVAQPISRSCTFTALFWLLYILSILNILNLIDWRRDEELEFIIVLYLLPLAFLFLCSVLGRYQDRAVDFVDAQIIAVLSYWPYGWFGSWQWTILMDGNGRCYFVLVAIGFKSLCYLIVCVI